MNARNEIASQVRNLLAYFPGRGRLPLVWLVILPLISTLYFSILFGRVAKLSSDGIPYGVFAVMGHGILWLYAPTVLVLLLRINHSARSSWRESASIIASSVGYGLIIGLPALLISVTWSACHVGISFLSVLQMLLGVFATIGGVLLLATALGAVAHYLGFFIPLFLLLAKPYVDLLPLAYSGEVLPEKWRMLHACAIPLSPAAVALRNAILNQPFANSTLYWSAATIHAILGFVLAFWIWRRITEQTDAPNPA